MAKKIQLQDANGNVLHPLTLGECVTMSNGENLDTLMSKSQMFTPTITQDKSMFKVGTGVDVDYSANVKDGAYESLVFKGKSLVNLASEKTKSFTTSHFLRCTLSHELVNGKKYLLKWDITNNTIGAFDVRFLRTSDGVRSGAFTLNVPKVVTVTNDGFDAIEFFTNASSISQGLTATIDNIMVVEYVEGMENNISYFEGLCDSKMPILQNTGENLFDPNSPLPDNLNYFYNSDNKNQLTTHAQMLSCAIPVIKGKTYSFYFNHDEIPLKVHKSGVFPTFVSGGVGGNGYAHNVRTITAPMDGYFGIMFCYTEDGTTDNWTKVARDWKKQLKLTIVEGKSINTYIPYKTNILRTSEEIVLREVGGVCDTYNPLTGEYTKRIGEVVLDGSEGWGLSGFTNDNYFVAYCQATTNSAKANSKIKCDKIQYDSRVSVIDTVCEGINIIGDKSLRISMSKSRVSNLSDFTSWLQLNPVTIQYELAEPVTTIVKPSTMTPFAYQNGHVILESGFEGQSLLPEIEYSVVTGRTGQVTQNTKVLRKQEQQIIGLEELLLTQVVQMEYERTLLQFDYELQMMMLG